MRFLRQFGLILLFSFLGELLHILLPLPVPGQCVWAFVASGSAVDEDM